MSKFKVGDVVVLQENYMGVTAGAILTIQGLDDRTSTFQHGLWCVDGLPCAVFGSRLELYTQPVEDELPPAPESGLYFNHIGSRSASLKLEDEVIALGTNASDLKIRLTPETALVLASDLRRMAMSIKRKEKHNG